MSDPFYAERKAAARANLAFYRAFEALDFRAMDGVWLDDDCVKCVHPGWELLVGRDKVMASWEAIFRNTTRIRFDVSDVAVEIIGECAWVTAVEVIDMEAGGGAMRSRAVATNLFLRRDAEYRMVLHHASPVPGDDGTA